MALADDLFLIAHADAGGKLQLPPRQAGLGLAGALLAELVLSGNLEILGGALRVRDLRDPGDDLDALILRQIVAEPDHTALATWLAFLGQEAVDRVGRRVAREGIVRRQEVRRMWMSSVRYPPLDPDRAGRPTVRLQQAVWRAEPIPLGDMTLASLVDVSGLSKQVWFDSDANAGRYLASLHSALPRALFDLVAHTEAAIANAVITHRA